VTLTPAQEDLVAVFHRALLIARFEDFAEPMAAESIWIGGRSDRETMRDLERLESEGVLLRTKHSTYCDACGSSGVEHRYALNRAWLDKAKEPTP
jgi:hypothetical protein